MVAESLSQFPYKSSFCEINGHRLHYIDEGSGDTILMIHGNPTWSYYYRNMIQKLKGSFRTIALDHVGCGLSDKPSDREYGYTLKERVEDLSQFCQKLHLDNITLMLHDWGGMIGMAYATQNTHRIKRIILSNTAAFPLPREKPFPWILKIVRLAVIGDLLVRGLNLFGIGASWFCSKSSMPTNTRKGYLFPYHSWQSRIALLRFVQDIPESNLHPTYDQVEAVARDLPKLHHLPIQILWGEKDFIFDHHFLNRWLEFFPKADVHLFQKAGHYLLEDAWEEASIKVHQFLNAHPVK